MPMPKSRTQGDFLDEMTEKWPERELIVFEDQRYTYRQFQEVVNRAAKSLIRLGIKKGEKVSTLVNNRPELMVIMFAVAKCGGVFVPLSTFYRATELSYALKHCDVKVFFTVGELLNYNYLTMVKEVLPDLERDQPGEFEGYPELRQVITLDESVSGGISWEEFLKIGDDVSDEELTQIQSAVKSNDPVFILLTSGSTSHPKACVLLHYGTIENPYNIGERQNLTPEDRMWVGIPIFYAMFLTNAMGAVMSHGGAFVIQAYFDPLEALRLFEEERCTVVYGFYNMISTIMAHPDREKRDLSSLRTGETIGTPEEMRRMSELVPNICQVYGLTEVYGNTHLSDSRDSLEIRMAHAGKLLPGFQLRFLDPETGQDVEAGQPGEVCVKGYVTPGYYKDPENNELAFDEDGWFHTGDIAKEDDKGNLYFITRLKEMIKTGGINVSPASVENYLLSHPKIKAVYVTGTPDEKRGEAVTAAVELMPDEDVTPEEIIQYCRGRIAGYSIPTRVVFFNASEWPMTSTGKIPRIKVRELSLQKLDLTV